MKLSRKNILRITTRTWGKVIECTCVIVSLRLSWGNFKSLWILAMLVVVWRRWKWSKVNGWNIRHLGASSVRWGPSGVDISGEYTLGYGTDCMLNEVRWHVIKCACVIGPCRQMLSWSNFRRVLFEILQAEFNLEKFQKSVFWGTSNDDLWVPQWWEHGMRLWWPFIDTKG